MKKSKNIDSYIQQFPKDIQPLLQKVRKTIKRAAPKAEEAIRYGIPTFIFHKTLVHFGGFKNHIGFFPAPSGITKFKKELLPYKTSKGTVQFLLKNPIPFDLIYAITKFRVAENIVRETKKKKTVS